MIDIKVKICGLNSASLVETAVDFGASYIGCSFNKNSINYITPLFARDICFHVSEIIEKIAVVSNISDKNLSEVMFYFKPDFVQFNGTESSEYISIFKEKFNCKVIKTIFLHSKKDLNEINSYLNVADMFLFEPTSNYLERHNNKKFFDWQILQKIQIDIPYMISDNISKHNLAFLIRASKAKIISVDSSLESGIGIKDPILIKEFMDNLRNFCAYEPNE